MEVQLQWWWYYNIGTTGGGNQRLSLTSGALTVSSGTVNVNGNWLHSSGTFTQSGGTVNVDGNAAGTTANSVASGTHLVHLTTGSQALTGGTFVIVDPHTSASASDYAFLYFLGATIHYNSAATHTFQIGNGVSTDAGGNAGGFILAPWGSNGRFSFGNLTINAPAGTNRTVQTTSSYGVNGNLTVSNGELIIGPVNTATLYVTGNIVNNGTITAIAPVYFRNIFKWHCRFCKCCTNCNWFRCFQKCCYESYCKL
jgi:hypothetical protein